MMRPSKRSDRQRQTLCGVASAFIMTFPLSALSAVKVPKSITEARNWAAANSTDATAITSDICTRVNAATTSRAVDQERTNPAQRKADGKYLIGSLQKAIKDLDQDRDELDKQIAQRTATVTAEVDAGLKAINEELESLSAAYLEKKKKSDKVDSQLALLDDKELALRDLADKVIESHKYVSNTWNDTTYEYTKHRQDRTKNLETLRGKLKELQNEGLRVPDPNLFKLEENHVAEELKLNLEPLEQLGGQLDKERVRLNDLEYTYSSDPTLARYSKLQSSRDAKASERKRLLDKDEKLKEFKEQKQKTGEQRVEAQARVSELNDRIEALDRAAAGIRACVEAKLKTLVERKKRLLADSTAERDYVHAGLRRKQEAVKTAIKEWIEKEGRTQRFRICPKLDRMYRELQEEERKLKEDGFWHAGTKAPLDRKKEQIRTAWKQFKCAYDKDKKEAVRRERKAEYDKFVRQKRSEAPAHFEKEFKEFREAKHQAAKEMLTKVIHPLKPMLASNEAEYEDIDRDIQALLEKAYDDIRRWLNLESSTAGVGKSQIDLETLGRMFAPFRMWINLEQEERAHDEPTSVAFVVRYRKEVPVSELRDIAGLTDTDRERLAKQAHDGKVQLEMTEPFDPKKAYVAGPYGEDRISVKCQFHIRWKDMPQGLTYYYDLTVNGQKPTNKWEGSDGITPQDAFPPAPYRTSPASNAFVIGTPCGSSARIAISGTLYALPKQSYSGDSWRDATPAATVPFAQQYELTNRLRHAAGGTMYVDGDNRVHVNIFLRDVQAGYRPIAITGGGTTIHTWTGARLLKWGMKPTPLGLKNYDVSARFPKGVTPMQQVTVTFMDFGEMATLNVPLHVKEGDRATLHDLGAWEGKAKLLEDIEKYKSWDEGIEKNDKLRRAYRDLASGMARRDYGNWKQYATLSVTYAEKYYAARIAAEPDAKRQQDLRVNLSGRYDDFYWKAVEWGKSGEAEQYFTQAVAQAGGVEAGRAAAILGKLHDDHARNSFYLTGDLARSAELWRQSQAYNKTAKDAGVKLVIYDPKAQNPYEIDESFR